MTGALKIGIIKERGNRLPEEMLWIYPIYLITGVRLKL